MIIIIKFAVLKLRQFFAIGQNETCSLHGCKSRKRINTRRRTMSENNLLEITLRLVVALLLGGAVGIEREWRSKDAGFRTHFLVAVGSALFCVVSQYGFDMQVKDSSRVAAQVVSGIGFLGAGTIIFQKNVIRGLTTAAGLWVTAAIGLACGSGMYVPAAMVTLMVIAGLELLNPLLRRISTSMVKVSFQAGDKESVKKLVKRLKRSKIDIIFYELQDKKTDNKETVLVNIDMKVKRNNPQHELMYYLEEFDNVTVSYIE